MPASVRKAVLNSIPRLRSSHQQSSPLLSCILNLTAPKFPTATIERDTRQIRTIQPQFDAKTFINCESHSFISVSATWAQSTKLFFKSIERNEPPRPNRATMRRRTPPREPSCLLNTNQGAPEIETKKHRSRDAIKGICFTDY